jgi:hypothetical protein
LGKVSSDGILHIKHAASGFEFIGSFSRVMFICPKNFYTRNGKKECGCKTIFDNPSQTYTPKAQEKIPMAC